MVKLKELGDGKKMEKRKEKIIGYEKEEIHRKEGFGPREEPVSLGKPVMSAENEAEIESEEVSRKMLADKMAHDIENQLDNLSDLSRERCIYRVPKRLRQGNEKAYTPQVVSIGPLHHDEEPLKAMEEHKLRYLRVFLKRPRVCFCDPIQMIMNHEEKLRDFYADSFEFSSEKFVKIVLVDAAFVIELLMRNRYQELQDPDDYIFKNPRMLWDVRPDLRLLENQLPFFILRDLFNKLSVSPHLDSLLKLSYHFFENEIDGGGKEENLKKICSSGEEVQHFVDLIRILYRPLEPGKKHKTRDKHNITATPNVTELQQAGVKVVVRKGSSLFDIKFSRGTLKICRFLKIPKLRVNDTTDLTLRNLLAFEQCHHREEGYLANYVFLMKRLAKTREDVQLLVEKGIIENWLGDTQKISTLLHDLGTGMMVDHHYYAPLCEDLIEYREKRRHEWMVILKEDYFKTPWSILSFIAAFILLVLTLVQTTCSYKSVPLL